MRHELADSVLRASRSARRDSLALSLAPPALAGLLLRRQIERRCGGPRSIAAALLAGAGAMALADATAPLGRRAEQAGALDGLALGVAQALALIPGVSRSGATLAAARARGYAPGEAARLSWEAGLPVIVGVGLLEALRSMQRGSPAEGRAAPAAGAGASFLSTLLAARLTRGMRSRGTSLVPFAVYRSMLAIVVVRRLRSAHNRDG
jgi:undecaprenyl-diphosphatase